MRYRLLGPSGLKVSNLCLGAMTFGEEWGWGSSKAESRRVFDGFADAGGNFIDTAGSYTNGTSELYLGEFVRGQRDRFVVATKYSASTDPSNPNAAGNSRKNLRDSVDASLNRLGTDYIDLLWLHVWDFLTPVEEVMRSLDDLVASGKVLYVGISNAPAWVVSRCQMLAELRGWSPFVGVQVLYSLTQRDVEREYLPLSDELDLAVCCWSPLDQGVLSGKYTREGEASGLREQMHGRRFNDHQLAVATAVDAAADACGHSSAQVALAWLLQRSSRAVPVVGARTPEQLEDNLAASEIVLPDSVFEELERTSRTSVGWPHYFFGSVSQRGFTYGEVLSQLDTHRAVPFRDTHPSPPDDDPFGLGWESSD
ncbi:aldo/keto reductase [Myxococcota bacterium]|nr:aldo/keto reductase [Myxococcota bacterium]